MHEGAMGFFIQKGYVYSVTENNLQSTGPLLH